MSLIIEMNRKQSEVTDRSTELDVVAASYLVISFGEQERTFIKVCNGFGQRDPLRCEEWAFNLEGAVYQRHECFCI